ncbi:MAG: hypothetical protein U5Q03_04720 [Bacteroidota bacterium]|nr:hypothetical protein [Bacteroidota bacterium]
MKYNEASMLQLWKFDDLKQKLDTEMASSDFEKTYNEIQKYPELSKLLDEVKTTDQFINKIGYSNLTPEQ